MSEEMKALELEAMGILEKHLEALSIELSEVGKKAIDLSLANANPIIKVIYGSSKEQIFGALKLLVGKLDLNKDGQ